jgi:hypothetical protein
MIEGASQVMDHVSGDGRDFGRIDVQWAHVEEWLASLRLRIEANQPKEVLS